MVVCRRRKQRPSCLLRIVVFLFATCVFSHQTWNISKDYFMYPTTTFVKLENFLPTTIGPQVGLRIPNELRVGRPVKETFDSVNETIKTKGTMRTMTFSWKTAVKKLRS